VYAVSKFRLKNISSESVKFDILVGRLAERQYPPGA
jgi:hypothetical protein